MQAGLRGLRKNEPIVIPQLDGSVLWRIKRYAPGLYFWATRQLSSELVERVANR